MPRIFRLFAVSLLLTYFAVRAFAQTRDDRAGGKSTSVARATNDSRTKEPGPYIDVTQYGVRAVRTPAATTGSISRASNRLTVANGSGFENGDGVVVRGAGANIVL